MIVRIALALALLTAAVAAGAQARAGSPAEISTARVVYLGLADDPTYEPQPSYTGLSLKDRPRPLDGARLAFRNTRVLGRALDLGFELEERLLAPGESAAGAVRAARATGSIAVLLDLPEAQMEELLASEGERGLLFNIRHSADRWRAEDCAPALLHTMPSRAMLADALAQYLRFRGWSRVLLLRGELPDDLEMAAAIRRAAVKFGLRIVAERDFVVTNDPRQRDSSNIGLLTGPPEYDVIWLADALGEFGRYVPYASYAPRPVVGAEGLSPLAWHWTWERYGAPQLNQRFRRLTGRDMTGGDWAAWAAARAAIEGVVQSRSTDPETVAATVRAQDFALDLYKGVRGRFRAWDGQLRQPILLATHNAVIAQAPIEGFEHRLDTLDTLGIDVTESRCER